MERKLRVNGEDKEYLSIHQWTEPTIMAGLPSTKSSRSYLYRSCESS